MEEEACSAAARHATVAQRSLMPSFLQTRLTCCQKERARLAKIVPDKPSCNNGIRRIVVVAVAAAAAAVAVVSAAAGTDDVVGGGGGCLTSQHHA